MLENLELIKMRAQAVNSDRQHNRMIMDKRYGFHRALLYSYQAVWVRKVNEQHYVRALMNPDKVKFDYDEKIISIDWEHGFKPGDAFEWGKDTNSYWIILKIEATEQAYLRANCRRCQQLTATDPETHEKFSQWVAVRGPVETKINTIQKANIVADVPNLTLNIYMQDNEQNRRTFERYQRFSFNDRYWKVTAPDSISTPGILEFTAIEDYECHNDDFTLIETEFVNDSLITGESEILPLEPHLYSFTGDINSGEWSITLPAEKNKEIDDVLEYIIIGNKIKVTWTGLKSGSFILHYGDNERTINVNSLF